MSTVTDVLYKETPSSHEVAFLTKREWTRSNNNNHKTARRRRKRKRYHTSNKKTIVNICLSSPSWLYILYLCKKKKDGWTTQQKTKTWRAWCCHERVPVFCMPSKIWDLRTKRPTPLLQTICTPLLSDEMGKASQYLRALSWTLSGCNDTSPAPSQTNWSFDNDDAAAAAEAARTGNH